MGIFVVGALVGIIVRNNPEILTSTVHQEPALPSQAKSPVTEHEPDTSRALPGNGATPEASIGPHGVAEAQGSVSATQEVVQSTVAKPSVLVEPADSGPALLLRRSVLMPGIACRTLDRRDLIVTVTVEVFFYGDSLANEILLKRDGLKVLVQNVLAHTPFTSVQSEPLRKRIQTELNSLLEKGKLSEVEFREFRVGPTGS